MVVLKPVLEGEFFKCCPKCQHIGLTSPIRERTSFYRDRRRGYRSTCRNCSRKGARTWEASHEERARELRRQGWHRRRDRMTPEQMEAYRAYRRAYHARKKADPAYVEKRRAQGRAYIASHKEQLKENRRIDWLLKKEREKLWTVPPLEEVESQERAGILMPVGPIRAWLEAMIADKVRAYLLEGMKLKTAETRAANQTAMELRTTARSLYHWRYETVRIDMATADRLVSRDGTVTLEEIYRNGGIYIFSDYSYMQVHYWNPPEAEV